MDLATNYLGLPLTGPLVASASPLAGNVDTVKQMVDAGISAVVMHSIFEEVIRREELVNSMLDEAGSEIFGEATSYFPNVPGDTGDASGPVHRYLTALERAANAVDVPVIGSINGSSAGFWTGTARQLVDAGAAAIELNVYGVPDHRIDGVHVEDSILDILALVKESVDVPVAVKLSPYFSSIGAMAKRLEHAGADGLVLFNRFLQPDIDIERLLVTPGIYLSTNRDRMLPQTWIALLHPELSCSLAATSGVETAEDVVRYLLAGADVVMTASALLRKGPGYARTLLGGLVEWMQRKGFDSLQEVRGKLAVGELVDRADYDRTGYVTALQQVQAADQSAATWPDETGAAEWPG